MHVSMEACVFEQFLYSSLSLKTILLLLYTTYETFDGFFFLKRFGYYL